MWDLHAVSSGGSLTTLADISTVLAGGDRATVAGVPTHPDATLMYHGIQTTLADTILEYQLLNNDMSNPRQGFDYKAATSLIGSLNFRHTLRSQLQRLQRSSQNTAAANLQAFTIDWYPSTLATWRPTGEYSNLICDFNTFAATTAVTYQEKIYVPTIVLEAGKYAILGCKVSAVTTNPYAIVRFYHNDFVGYYPGFPVYDKNNFALARGVEDPLANIFFPDGWQFATMGECPVFTATAEGTGLTLAISTISAVTPVLNIILKKLADETGRPEPVAKRREVGPGR